MVAFYKHDIPSWMDGTEGLDDAEYRAYHVICQLIYLSECPISNHETGIAGRCNMHPLKFRAVLARLIDKKKIVWVGGKLSNPRAEVEVGKIEVRRRSRRGEEEVAGGSARGQPRKPLENKETPLGGDANRLDKTRLDKKEEDGAKAPVLPLGPVIVSEKPDARVYRRGREVLGPKAGGLIAKLIKAKGGVLGQAMAAIEHASTTSNPAEYIGGVLRKSDMRATAFSEGSDVYTTSLI